jgi:argininosuccinate lyase
VLSALSGVAQSASKAATDLRLLQSRKELEEPFEAEQIGSSAMAYKRNPMRAERICGLARFVISLESSAAQTAATQWLERTLDDSANRRLTLPQSFLAVDALLILYQNIAAGLEVRPAVIARHLAEELPFMATENILMAAVSRGGDRQHLHEQIRRHSQAAAAVVKDGGANDLLARLAATRRSPASTCAATEPLPVNSSGASRRVPGRSRRADPQERRGVRVWKCGCTLVTATPVAHSLRPDTTAGRGAEQVALGIDAGEDQRWPTRTGTAERTADLDSSL